MSDNNTESSIPQKQIESLARLLLPKIRQFFESEDGQREFAQWKQNQSEKVSSEAKL